MGNFENNTQNPLAARCCHLANYLTNFTGDRRTNEQTNRRTEGYRHCHRHRVKPPHLRAGGLKTSMQSFWRILLRVVEIPAGGFTPSSTTGIDRPLDLHCIRAAAVSGEANYHLCLVLRRRTAAACLSPSRPRHKISPITNCTYLKRSPAARHVSTVTGRLPQSPQDSYLQALLLMISPLCCRAR